MACVLNVNRDDGSWNRNVNRLANDNVWDPENRLVLGNSSLSPVFGGSFLFDIVFPSDKHFARFH